MSDATFITLTEAAKMTGRAKSSVSRALESGRMSYVSRDPVTGTYQIDPAEVLRVFPVRNATLARDRAGHLPLGPDATRHRPTVGPEVAELRERLARLEALGEGAERERRRMEEHIEDLRSRLERADREKDQLQALLATPRAEAAAPPRRGVWGFLRRRAPPA